MEVRPATPDDARAIAAVHVRSWQSGYRGIIRDDVLDAITVDDRAAMWRGYLTDPDNEIRTLVAEDGGEVVGFVSFVAASRDDDAAPGVAEIPALYVDPARWRNGAGRALVDAALARLQAGGAAEVTLWVLEDNDRGRAFYAACGFRPDGAHRTNELGPEEIRVRRELRATGPS